MASTLLIAASPGGAREILGAFDRHADYCLAQSFEEGLERLKERDFVAIVVGYYFDQGQPFRFISEAQAARPDVPILLVRPLPIAMRDSPEDIRSAYRQLGVADFFDYPEQAKRAGTEEAQRQLREAVARLISR
jgi:hypothetical protein